MRIKLLTSIASGDQPLQFGDIVDVSDEVGTAWVAEQMAIPVEPSDASAITHPSAAPVAAAAAAPEVAPDAAAAPSAPEGDPQ